MFALTIWMLTHGLGAFGPLAGRWLAAWPPGEPHRRAQDPQKAAGPQGGWFVWCGEGVSPWLGSR